MRLTWCQSGAPRVARTAVSAGWWYGFRSDGMHYAGELGPVELLDIDYQKPNWSRHVDVAARVLPVMAVVTDTMESDQIDRTLRQASEIAPYCQRIIIVPKADGIIKHLPREIGGKQVVLGYSVPTRYGATPLPVWAFATWPVHLLGGGHKAQVRLMSGMDVISADGNAAWAAARRGIVQGLYDSNKTVKELDGKRWEGNGQLEALRRSLVNMRAFWNDHVDVEWRPWTSTTTMIPTASCGSPS
jgi:hypothetical protein